MKRALAVLLVCGAFGVTSLAQLSGTWGVTLSILPTVGVTSTLTLKYSVAGWDFTSMTRMVAIGVDRQMFSIKGAMGPFKISGRMWFDPVPPPAIAPAYMGSDLITSFDFAGVSIGLTARHWDTTFNDCLFRFACWPFGPWDPDEPPCAPPQRWGMMYIPTFKVPPVTIKLMFADCTEGIMFRTGLFTIEKIPFCCGILLDAAVAFVREGGFDSLKIKGINVPICCGISFDFEVTYTTRAKSVTIKPKFAHIVGCLTVWGGVVQTPPHVLAGLAIYGFRIRCDIAECNYIELINAMAVKAAVDELNKVLPVLDRFIWDEALRRLCAAADPMVAIQEFELVKLGFCGPGCCGGRWEITLRLFFGDVLTSLDPRVELARIFDLTRLVFSASVPIMANLSVTASGTMYAFTTTPPCHTFSIGWTFTFP